MDTENKRSREEPEDSQSSRKLKLTSSVSMVERITSAINATYADDNPHVFYPQQRRSAETMIPSYIKIFSAKVPSWPRLRGMRKVCVSPSFYLLSSVREMFPGHTVAGVGMSVGLCVLYAAMPYTSCTKSIRMQWGQFSMMSYGSVVFCTKEEFASRFAELRAIWHEQNNCGYVPIEQEHKLRRMAINTSLQMVGDNLILHRANDSVESIRHRIWCAQSIPEVFEICPFPFRFVAVPSTSDLDTGIRAIYPPLEIHQLIRFVEAASDSPNWLKGATERCRTNVWPDSNVQKDP